MLDDPNVDLDEITDLMQNNDALKGKQIAGNYLAALGDVAIMKQTAEGTEFVGYLKDMSGVALDADSKYVMAISGKDGSGNDFNAANDNFKAEGDLSMRLWIRMSVTVAPMIFLLLSLLVQNKKFIIDEDYYDMMLSEIEKRKQSDEAQTASAE